MMNQLKLGKRVESEHKGTYRRLKAGKIKTAKDLYTSIAKDHLKEDKKYYSKLSRCKL